MNTNIKSNPNASVGAASAKEGALGRILRLLFITALLMSLLSCTPRHWLYDVVDKRFEVEDYDKAIFRIELQVVRLRVHVRTIDRFGLSVMLDLENKSQSNITLDPSHIRATQEGQSLSSGKRVTTGETRPLTDTVLVRPEKHFGITYMASFLSRTEAPPLRLDLSIGDICVETDSVPLILDVGEVQLELRDD
jgi:hypothetical protein